MSDFSHLSTEQLLSLAHSGESTTRPSSSSSRRRVKKTVDDAEEEDERRVLESVSFQLEELDGDDLLSHHHDDDDDDDNERVVHDDVAESDSVQSRRVVKSKSVANSFVDLAVRNEQTRTRQKEREKEKKYFFRLFSKFLELFLF
jgi:hypothetical protein